MNRNHELFCCESDLNLKHPTKRSSIWPTEIKNVRWLQLLTILTEQAFISGFWCSKGHKRFKVDVQVLCPQAGSKFSALKQGQPSNGATPLNGGLLPSVFSSHRSSSSPAASIEVFLSFSCPPFYPP